MATLRVYVYKVKDELEPHKFDGDLGLKELWSWQELEGYFGGGVPVMVHKVNQEDRGSVWMVMGEREQEEALRADYVLEIYNHWSGSRC